MKKYAGEHGQGILEVAHPTHQTPILLCYLEFLNSASGVA